MYNRRMSAAIFARPVFAGGALGIATACHAAGEGGESGPTGFGVEQQLMGARAAMTPSGRAHSAATRPIDITSALAHPPGAASRGASGSSGGNSGNALVSGGTTYSRGWWLVPTTRRVRGTTMTSTVRGGESGGDAGGDRGGDSARTASPAANTPSNLGGLLIHSGPDLDIIFVEPPRAGEPTTPIEIQLTRADGNPVGGIEKLARGCYYIVTDDLGKGVRLSRAYPWTSSAAFPHDQTALAVFGAIRKAALASGKPGMADLPDLVGP